MICVVRRIELEYRPRRLGDVAVAMADVSKAERELAWRPQHSLSEMMDDYWRFVSLHPRGYPDMDDVDAL